MVNVRDNIPSNLVKVDQKFENFIGFSIELELPQKKKWLLSYSCNPHTGNTKQNLSNISKDLDNRKSKYGNVFIASDLKSKITETSCFAKPVNLEFKIHCE